MERENKWKILGSASLEKVAEQLGVTFDTEDCDTFGGYILGILGEIPDDGTQLDLETEELSIRVESVSDHRIEETIVTVKPKTVDEDDDDYDDEDEDEDGEKKKKRKNKDKDKADDEAEPESDEKNESEKSDKDEKNKKN